MLERILNEGQVTEDDRYSDDPKKRQLFYLHSAAGEINRFLSSVNGDLTVFPQNSLAMLQSGESGLNIIYLLAIPQAIPPSHREEAIGLIHEIQGLALEKGFRFRSSLLTSREHKACGSSGYGGIYWETDPDIPIPILDKRLSAEGKTELNKWEKQDKPMTIEEIDRARRLMGMTRIDLATGRVTDVTDSTAANDSYYFLSPQRREEVIKHEQEIMAEIKKITQTAITEHAASQNFLTTLFAYNEGKILTPQLLEEYGKICANCSERYSLSLTDQIKALKQIAFESGIRDFMLTPQEILLRAGGIVDARYLTQPYVPLAIQDGLSVEEIAKLRRGEDSMVVNTALLEYSMPFGFRLEELDEQGNAVKSPTFLDRDDGESPIEDKKFRDYFGPQINFPLARPADWFYKDKSPLPIIGVDKFTLTEQSILDGISSIRQEIEEINKTINDPNEEERIRVKVGEILPRAKRNLAALTWGSPEEVLAKVRNIYERTLALAKSGLGEIDIAAQIFKEYPDIVDYNDLIEGTTDWGYHLIQNVVGYKKFGA